MKNKLYNHLIVFINIILLIELFINKELIINTTHYSLNIWVTSIIPSLFPIFIISELLINYNIINYIPKFIKNIFKYLFNINDNELTIFLISLIAGFPSASVNTKIMYDKKLLNIDECNHILMFTHFGNPIFILTTIGLIFFNNELLGIIIFISHYLSNFILGILLRNFNNKRNINNKNNNFNINFGTIFINSIKHTIDTLLTILGTLTCFLIIGNILINRLNLSNYNSCILKGILEITMGIKELSILNIKDIYKVVLSTIFLSFGGLSIHMQVISQICYTKIKYKYFLIGRIFQSIISGIISYIIYNIVF